MGATWASCGAPRGVNIPIEEVREMMEKYESRLYRRVESAFTGAGQPNVLCLAWPKALERGNILKAILKEHGYE